jgi:hypothetical protein
VATDANSTTLLRQLDDRLTKWMRDSGDSWRFNSMLPVEDKGRLYRFETFYTIESWSDGSTLALAPCRQTHKLTRASTRCFSARLINEVAT